MHLPALKTISVADATALQLDWLVASKLNLLRNLTQARNVFELCKKRKALVFTHGQRYSPTSDPAQGQPLMDAAGISIMVTAVERVEAPEGDKVLFSGPWKAQTPKDMLDFEEGSYGDTMLIAGIRAWVHLNYGGTAKVPQDLC